jgi:hypothetical protein
MELGRSVVGRRKASFGKEEAGIADGRGSGIGGRGGSRTGNRVLTTAGSMVVHVDDVDLLEVEEDGAML